MKQEKFYEYVVNCLFKSTHLIKKGTRPFTTGTIDENYTLSFDFINSEVPDLTYSLVLLQRYHTSSISFICFHSQFPQYVMDNFGVLEDEVEFIWERFRKRIIDTLIQNQVMYPMQE